MRVIIIGAGNTGTQLAKYLINEKHDVTIIESDEDRARHVSNRLDCIVIHDNGNKLKALDDAGILKADALVCVTDSDELNMITCGLAASLFTERTGALLKIARVRGDEYIHMEQFNGRQVLGVDLFIHPGIEAARSIIEVIEHGVIGDIFSFSDTPYEMGSINIAAGSAMDGLVLSGFRRLVTYESLVTLVIRKDDVMLPSGSTVLKSGDIVHILADSKNLPEIYKLAGDVQSPIRKIGIVGGGKMGSLIAEGILDQNSIINQNKRNKKTPKKSFFNFPKFSAFKNAARRVVIIEQDSRLCNELAARFPSALILNEDMSDENTVNEEVFTDIDCLITTTANEEINIITAVYMKSRGIARTIALVTGSGHAAMARHLGVDVVIPMQSVVVNSILSHLMGSSIKELRSVGNDNFDLLEIEINKNAPITGSPITSFRLSSGSLLLLVNRGGDSFIPKGDYIFHEGDRIVLLTGAGSKAEIDKYFNTDK